MSASSEFDAERVCMEHLCAALEKETYQMRLNLGCGPQKLTGWINIDFDEKHAPDVVADVKNLPYADNSVDEIYASHILEHFNYDEPVLEEWCRVLKPRGMITVIVPDVVGTWYAWKAGLTWGHPTQRPIDLAYVNATAFGAKILNMGFLEKGHEHKQIFIMDMLVERMRNLFPDARQISNIVLAGKPIRDVFPGETIVRGTKFGAAQKRGLFRVEGEGSKISGGSPS
jgi:predicted SAM-dependent methyltransferase